jgi:hypothetical protein
MLQKSKRKKEEHATRKVEAQKEQLRRWKKRPLTKKEKKFEQKSKIRN